MTARQVTFQTAVFSGSDTTSANNVSVLPETIAFEDEDLSIRTLTTDGISGGETVQGTLFYPSLSTETCKNATATYVNENATTYTDIPHISSVHLIAFAPWTGTAQCTYEYLNSASSDPLLKAIVFYLTDNSSTTPPAADDEMWNLGDDGSWKENDFGIYAVSGYEGRKVMNMLSAYSGNLTTVPNGHELSEYYHPSDYVRLIATIPTSGGSNLPSLWVFLLIVLGLLILVLCASTFVMHWLQRRRRNDLRNRVIRGEVDLEALGIRRLTVPQEVLDKMPLYVYTDHASTPVAEVPPETAAAEDENISSAPPSTEVRPTTFSQPTCAICLDDYVAGETTVRELPCHHVYHPECIDNFLRDNSSLCPLCKKTVLPRGYCPAVITNSMVRRERWVRRIRERAAARGVSQADLADEQQRIMAEERNRRSMLDAMAILMMGGQRPTARRQRRARQPDVEMQQTSSDGGGAIPISPTVTATAAAPSASASAPVTAVSDTATPSAPVHPSTSTNTAPTGATTAPSTAPSSRPAQGTASRREWARQRALALLGRGNRGSGAEDVEEEEEPRRGRMRKALGRVFPGL